MVKLLPATVKQKKRRLNKWENAITLKIDARVTF
jgi:hypothetical protein